MVSAEERKKYMKQWYLKNKERIRQYQSINREKILQQRKEYRQTSKAKELKKKDDHNYWIRHKDNLEFREAQKNRVKKCYANPEKYQKKLEKQRKTWLERKIRVYNHYSNYDIKCNCCGERRVDFLTVDHINNNGASHRKELGHHLVHWIIKNNFPKEFQILCSNCNTSKGKNKEHICIHKKETNDCIFDYQVIA